MNILKLLIIIAYIITYKVLLKLSKAITVCFRKFKIGVLLIIIVAIATLAILAYRYIGANNVNVPENGKSLFIYKNMKYNDVLDSLYSKDIIINQKSFEVICNLKKYPELVKAGHYLISPKMSNIDIVNMLRSGSQKPVDITFNNIRTIEDLAGHLAKHTESDSLDYIKILSDNEYLKEYNLNKETVLTHFIPNTYQVYWTISPKMLMKKMDKENKLFWETRKKKANKLGMTTKEVYILSSIVEKETHVFNERKMIAGVYLNRLKRRMRLQADPTVVFALKAFDKKRVLIKDTQFDSPYNTYKYRGLPPGPIYMPSVSAIDAVLNHTKHKYYYFCADPQNIGLHLFARSLRDHNKNARKYHRMLNKRKIFK